MATRNNNYPSRTMPQHSWAWRAAAAVRAGGWPMRLAAGMVAWVAVGVVTVLIGIRPGGYGAADQVWLDHSLIDLCGGVVPWLVAGVGLTATALITHGYYRRRGALAATAAGVLTLAAAATATALAAAVDWGAVAVGIVTVVGFVYMLYLMAVHGVPDRDDDDDDGALSDDGYRDGWDGWGWYEHGQKVRD